MSEMLYTAYCVNVVPKQYGTNFFFVFVCFSFNHIVIYVSM